MTMPPCTNTPHDGNWYPKPPPPPTGARRCPWGGWATLLILTLLLFEATGARATLNDSGIDWWADGTTHYLTSEPAGYPGQDASQGRDRFQDNDGDGHAGFSFTKLDANGAALPAGATTWSCVRDNVTGLIWEVKTNDGGLHDRDDSYNWYDTNPETNGGFEGYANYSGAICSGCSASDPASWCNTQAYVARVNAAGWCGASDWRLPTLDELRGIVDYSCYNVAIDTNYFPDTQSNWYWSASPRADVSAFAWNVSFYYGSVGSYYKLSSYSVRLVRGGQALPSDSYALSPKATAGSRSTSLEWTARKTRRFMSAPCRTWGLSTNKITAAY